MKRIEAIKKMMNANKDIEQIYINNELIAPWGCFIPDEDLKNISDEELEKIYDGKNDV